MSEPSTRIPQTIRDNAKCIAVFPQVVKFGLLVVIEGGQGLIACRNKDDNEWGSPAMYQLNITSLGLQFGVSRTSIILAYMDDEAVSSLLQPKMTFGGDLELQAGPVAMGAEIDLNKVPSIVSYVRAKGLFLGVKLEGGKIAYLEDQNAKIYNENLTPEQLLFEKREVPESVKIYHDTIEKYSQVNSEPWLL